MLKIEVSEISDVLQFYFNFDFQDFHDFQKAMKYNYLFL